ncbi:MMPL family transporter [Actinomadura darangshiensis]|uniref:MMPL family transporter n=1 Tax=Actinomadura darangshiensis TaxID=705336 RepID=A0A4R5BMG5_9ACTN|nr:MMPL family transporter [Actinomadura darangshiensis]TDD86503.1 MMPL family transporter [Actinomadura darangshiensis]
MSAVHRLSGLPVGRLTKWLVVLFWIVVFLATGSLSAKLADAQKNDASQWLPGNAESARALQVAQRFHSRDTYPALVVYKRDGTAVTAADRAKAAADARRFATLTEGAGGAVDSRVVGVAGPMPSKDGQVLETVVQIKVGAKGWPALGPMVDRLRATARAGGGGLQAHVAGQAGFQADSSKAFTGLDSTLLGVTVLVVIAILVLTYRSPILWVLPLIGAFLSLNVAQAIIYGLARHGGLTVSGESSFVLIVLVFGVATDYTLLIVSRYREELRRHADRHAAMAAALRRASLSLAASAGIVVLAMLCLTAADLNSTRSLGPVAAIGVAVSLAVMLTFLPALLVVFGRWMFWPARPLAGSAEPDRAGLWARAGGVIAARPRAIWIGTVVVLGALSFGVLGLNANGFSGANSFRGKPDSVVGQQVSDRHFPAGAGQPLQVVGRAGAGDALAAAVSRTPGVAGVGAPRTSGDAVYLEATLTAQPGSSAAYRTVDRVRSAAHAVPGAQAKVGGGDAVNLDVLRASRHDRAVVIPLVTLGVLVLLLLVLRAVVAPLVLVGTVLLAFGAALGLSALVFDHLAGLPAADPSFPLWAFVFMVALGVDYNIFLATRMREEALLHGPRPGVLRSLAATGGVITSAGVVVAGTFGALGVLPLAFMAEIGIAVALGVLLDTFVVRSVLVSAVALDLGRWMWWPGEIFRRGERADEAAPAAESASVAD